MSQVRQKDPPKCPAQTLLTILTEFIDLLKMREAIKKEERIQTIFWSPSSDLEEYREFCYENYLRLKKESEIKKIQRFHTISTRSKNIRAFNSTISHDQFKESRAVLDTFCHRADMSEKTLAHTKFNCETDLAYLG